MIIIRNYWFRMAGPLNYLECTLIDLLSYKSLQMLASNDGILITLSGQIIS